MSKYTKPLEYLIVRILFGYIFQYYSLFGSLFKRQKEANLKKAPQNRLYKQQNTFISSAMNSSRRPHRKTRNQCDESAQKKRRSTRLAKKFNFNKVYTESNQIKITIEDDDLQIINKEVYDKELKNSEFHQEPRENDLERLYNDESPSKNNQYIPDFEQLPKLFDSSAFNVLINEQVHDPQQQRPDQIESIELLKRKNDYNDDSEDNQERIKKKLKLNSPIKQSMHAKEAEGDPIMIGSADQNLLKSNQTERKNQIQKQIHECINQLQLVSSQNTALLKEKVAKQIHSLLEYDPLPLQEIINYDSLDIHVDQLPDVQENINFLSCKKKEQSSEKCANCQKNREIQSQLNELFNELLLKQIDLDQLFLEQELLLILQNINPSPKNSWSKIQKLVDISDNKLLCQLILKKINHNTQQDSVFQQYFISKIVRINGDWFAILQVNKFINSAKDHYKYLAAKQLLSVYREQLVTFLIR